MKDLSEISKESLADKSKLRPEVRFWLLEKRRELEPSGAWARQSSDLGQICAQRALEKPGVWGVFRPLKFEPSVDWDKLSFSGRGLQWAYPEVQGDQLLWWRPGNKGFYRGSFCEEPVREGAVEVQASELQGLLIPGLAFDQSGTRLGQGQGFYDRTLRKLRSQSSKCVFVGVGFSFQMLPAGQFLPRHNGDEDLDEIWTEQGRFK